jgi:hypothetical protein
MAELSYSSQSVNKLNDPESKARRLIIFIRYLMNFSFLENAVIKYIEAHPELIERILNDVITRLLTKLEPSTASK